MTDSNPTSTEQDREPEEKNRPNLKIQDRIPLRSVGIETERENKDFTHMPPHRYLHVWFARRPTPVSRLAILSTILSDDVTDDTLLKWMGMNPDNRKEGVGIAEHIRDKRLTLDDRDGAEYEHMGYRKIWRKTPDSETIAEIHQKARETWGGELPTILDATAGGGSIPFESVRYDFPTIANELNPVASVILKGVLEHPRLNEDLSQDIREWGDEINSRVRDELSTYFPSQPGEKPVAYLWSHVISCPDCGLDLPLTNNWWLDKDSGSEGVAARPIVGEESDRVEFDVIELPDDIEKSDFNPTEGTISYGKATCPRCDVVTQSKDVKEQAKDNGFGYQLYAVYYEEEAKAKKGKRGYRAPIEADERAFDEAQERVEQDPELATFLRQEIPHGEKTRELHRNGMSQWRDLFSPRQLLVHHTYLEKYREVKEEIEDEYTSEQAEAILTYLAMAADKALDYNCRLCKWHPDRSVLGHAFAGSDFAFSWSFPENNLIVDGHGYEWTLGNVLSAYDDLYDLSGDSDAPTTVLQEDASNLSLDDQSVEAIVLDPPYYQNVMYAELSDFFYVWMQQYLGEVYPNFFTETETEKQEEAVANPSLFEDVAGEKSKKKMADRHYEQKMADIFTDLRRVLTDEGVFTMMFTHKETDAWDTLTKALIRAGFVITATHPINSEDPNRVQMMSKNSAESTILLTSEKLENPDDRDPVLWEDIQTKTREVARERVKSLDESDMEMTNVDMILASYGPTLEVYTQNHPVVDETGEIVPPETALDEAREAVRGYFIDKYLNEGIRGVDRKTEWYTLAWLMFEAERFPYDEGRRLAIGVGENLDSLKREHRMWRKKGDNILLRPHGDRVKSVNKSKENRSSRKPVDPEAVTFSVALDKVHAVMHIYDAKGATEAWNWMKTRDCASDPEFKATIEALLRVLPEENDDREILRNLVAGETGEYLNLDLESSLFKDDNNDDKPSQSTFSDVNN